MPRRSAPTHPHVSWIIPALLLSNVLALAALVTIISRYSQLLNAKPLECTIQLPQQ